MGQELALHRSIYFIFVAVHDVLAHFLNKEIKKYRYDITYSRPIHNWNLNKRHLARALTRANPQMGKL